MAHCIDIRCIGRSLGTHLDIAQQQGYDRGDQGRPRDLVIGKVRGMSKDWAVIFGLMEDAIVRIRTFE